MAHAIHALITVEYASLTPTVSSVQRVFSGRSVRTDVEEIVQEHATRSMDTVRRVVRMDSTLQKATIVYPALYIARYANPSRNV